MPAIKTWKETERTIAKRLGGHRLGFTGRANEDVATSRYVVEVKHKKRLPDWMHSAMKQAQGAAVKKPDHLALVVFHQSGMRHSNDYVMVRLDNFIEWFGDVPVSEDCGGEDE